MPARKSKESELNSVAMSNPSTELTAPPIVDPLEPQHLVYSPRPTRQRKPSQKMNSLSNEIEQSLPPVFPTPRVSLRKGKKRVHHTDDDEAAEVEDANDSDDANDNGRDGSYDKPKKGPRGTYLTKKRRLEAEQAAFDIKKSEPAGMVQEVAPPKYKSPYQQEDTKLLHSPTVSATQLQTHKAVVPAKPARKLRANTKKKSDSVTATTSALSATPESSEPKKRAYNKRTPAGPLGYLAPVHQHPPLSVQLMAQQHEALVINIASTLTREQLFNMVTYGCTHPEARLFDLLLAENAHRPAVFTTPVVGPPLQIHHHQPHQLVSHNLDHMGQHIGPMNQIVRAPQALQPLAPALNLNGNGSAQGHVNGNGKGSHTAARPTTAQSKSSATTSPAADETEEEDDGLSSPSEDDDFSATNTNNTRDRLITRSLREGQWKNSSKAYLVPEGKNPPTKGPIPVGVIKRGKNVVHAGFDYRMRFHWRLTKYDREGNPVAYNNRTPATSRDKVDLHPTLANLHDDDFYREVLRRQLCEEAK